MSDSVQALYNQRGYYIAKDLLVKQRQIMVDLLLQLDSVLVQQLHIHYPEQTFQPATDANCIHTHLRQLLQASPEAYIAALKLSANLLSVHTLLISPPIMQLVQQLGLSLPVLQTAPVLHIMADDLRIPGGYHGAEAHQDWPSLQSSLDTTIIWVPLTPVTTNFPVEAIPGSHLGGLYPGEVANNVYRIHTSQFADVDFVPAELGIGDALAMSGFTIHRTRMQGSSGFRMACSIRYDNANEATYAKRAYPHAQKRTVTREFIHADFPSKEQVQAIFTSE